MNKDVSAEEMLLQLLTKHFYSASDAEDTVEWTWIEGITLKDKDPELNYHIMKFLNRGYK